jgi:hypothetical protein
MTMQFKGEGSTVVWDARADRELCRFAAGKLETEDIDICNKLIALGYEHEGELPDNELEELKADELKVKEDLKAKAKELKVKGWAKMSQERLAVAVAEAEDAAELQSLNEQAAALGIIDLDGKDAETLRAEIAEKGGAGDDN